MGRYLKYLIMFGPTIFRFVKKFMASKSNTQASNNRNLPQQQNGRNQQTQRGQKDFDFKEGENPLG